MIWQLAGVIGLAPGPFTLRELVWMADSRQTDAWNHTAVCIQKASIQIPPVVFHSGTLQQLNQLLAKRFLSVMRFLILDVASYSSA